MSRLTLRLPDTLHRQLENLAREESVSLNQYIVYALTKQATLAYTVEPLSDEAVRQQPAAFAGLLQGLGKASQADIDRLLAEREQALPDESLTEDIVKAVNDRISRRRLS